MKRALLEVVVDLIPFAVLFGMFWLGLGVWRGDPDWAEKATRFAGFMAFLNMTTLARKVRALEGER